MHGEDGVNSPTKGFNHIWLLVPPLAFRINCRKGDVSKTLAADKHGVGPYFGMCRSMDGEWDISRDLLLVGIDSIQICTFLSLKRCCRL